MATVWTHNLCHFSENQNGFGSYQPKYPDLTSHITGNLFIISCLYSNSSLPLFLSDEIWFHLQWFWVFNSFAPDMLDEDQGYRHMLCFILKQDEQLIQSPSVLPLLSKILSAVTSSILGNWKTGHACHHASRRLDGDTLPNGRDCCLFP